MHTLSRRHFIAATGTLAGASLLNTSLRAASPPTPVRSDVTLAIADYQRYFPLATGEVPAPGLNLIRGVRGEMLSRTLTDPTVDGGEGSMLGHLLRIDQGDTSMLAIPVFLLRNFTSRDIYVREGSTLTPTQLEGRRIGIYNWAASGAVWYRQLVRYLGQDPAKIRWIVGGTDAPVNRPGRAILPSHVANAPEDQSLSDLLLKGEIDACFVPGAPAKYHPHDGPIVRLLPDYRSVDEQYFRDTGIYPMQHVMLLRRAKWEQDPSIGRRLMDLFNACEERFCANQRQFPYNTPWQIEEVERTELLMGRDYHAHSYDKSAEAMDLFCRNAHEDGLTTRLLTARDYFADFLRT